MAQEIANLGGWVWDLRENKINFTPQALKLLGLDVNQKTLPADQFFYLIHPNETENLKNAIATMKSGRSGYSEIYTFIRPDKDTRQIRFSAEVSAFFNHFPIEISGILQDVTKLTSVRRKQSIFSGDHIDFMERHSNFSRFKYISQKSS